MPLGPYTTLRAGGPAETLHRARCADDLARAAIWLQGEGVAATCLGWGSNVLPSDKGLSGVTMLNFARRISIEGDRIEAECGCGLQELFLKSAQAGLGGLEFAVGIPGTLGGALVSNAGAYRSNVSRHLTEIELVFEGERRWVPPSFMEFSYRDSILRRNDPPPIVLLQVRMQMPRRHPKEIYDEARDYQRQRIAKQPPPASAGSFFKNVNDRRLAQVLPGLSDGMRENGVVPSGFLIQEAGLKGMRVGGAMLSPRHANFVLNVGDASASDIRTLAERVKKQVLEKFGVALEEEVLYIGDWSGWEGLAA